MSVLTRTWAILMALTALSLLAGRPGGEGSIGMLGSGLVLLAATFKADQILTHFLGLQGRRMKSARQKRQHVLIIPGGLLATGPHADPGCSAATYEIDSDLAQDSQIASCRSIPDAAVSLPAGATYGTPIRERCLPKTPSPEFRYSFKPGPVSLVQAAAHSCGDHVQR